jgi:pyruvate/2-oxoglutarate dehydrogenase complex dihydrolipoamide acyltransferase (E2) component
MRFVTILAAVLFALSLCACSEEAPKAPAKPEKGEKVAPAKPVAAPAPAPAPAPAAEKAPAPAPAAEKAPAAAPAGDGPACDKVVEKIASLNPPNMRGDAEKKLWNAMCSAMKPAERTCVMDAKAMDDMKKCVANKPLK